MKKKIIIFRQNKSVSLKKVSPYLDDRNIKYAKHPYFDPSFKKKFCGVIFQKDFYIRNIFDSHFSPNTKRSKTKITKIKKPSFSGPREVFLSSDMIKPKITENLYDFCMTKADLLRTEANPYRAKYGFDNFGSKKHRCIQLPNLSQTKKNFYVKIDDYTDVQKIIINKIDKKYKDKLKEIELSKMQLKVGKSLSLNNDYLKERLNSFV